MTRNKLVSHVELSYASRKILEQAMTKMGLSTRAYDHIIKVSRTIADSVEQENIDILHDAEAI